MIKEVCTIITLLPISLFGQEKDSSNVSKSTDHKSWNFGIYYGLKTDRFNDPLYGIE